MDAEQQDSAVFPIRDKADLNVAISRLGRLGLLREGSEVDQALVKTMVSELGSNIVKYAGRGSITVSRVVEGDCVDIDVEAVDRGPGIEDVERALEDHYSSGGSLGLGLPSVRRIADSFVLRSARGEGTRVLVRKRIRGPRVAAPATTGRESSRGAAGSGHTPWETGSCVRAMRGQQDSGDLALAIETSLGVLLVVADATGHGEVAHQLACDIELTARAHRDAGPRELLGLIHASLRGTVGAAVGLLVIDRRLRMFRYVAVGNTAAARCAGSPWRGVSKDGVLGQRQPTLFEQSGMLADGDLLVLWTDGIPDSACKRFVEQNSYLSAQHLAFRVVTELGKAYDDAACLVLRWRTPECASQISR